MSSGINQENNLDPTVSFWDPINYRGYAQTHDHMALERIDDYFYLGGRVAVVYDEPLDPESTPVHIQLHRPDFLLTVIKVISYATVIIPIIMLIAKCILRAKYDFHYDFHDFQHGLDDLNPVDNTLEPVMTISTSDTGPVASLLKNYKLGKNARSCSELMLKIHSNIPNPHDLQLYSLHFMLATLGNIEIRDEEDGVVKRVGHTIVQYYDDLINREYPRTDWEDRFLKMTFLVYENIMKLAGDELESAKTILASGLIDSFAHCRNRKSTEIERLYDLYVVPELLAAAQDADMPKEKLMYEFMNFRMKFRDEIINRKCFDLHNASSHRYFRAKLDQNIFYLPPPPLCDKDEAYAMFAQWDQESAIIHAFQNHYHNPKTIFDIFTRLINPVNSDKFQYKPAMFMEWLGDKGLLNPDSFTDEDMTVFKPDVIIRFLTDQGFLAHK
jgi:hypothetical protein